MSSSLVNKTISSLLSLTLRTTRHPSPLPFVRENVVISRNQNYFSVTQVTPISSFSTHLTPVPPSPRPPVLVLVVTNPCVDFLHINVLPTLLCQNSSNILSTFLTMEKIFFELCFKIGSVCTCEFVSLQLCLSCNDEIRSPPCQSCTHILCSPRPGVFRSKFLWEGLDFVFHDGRVWRKMQ